jgi:hypothetical protein
MQGNVSEMERTVTEEKVQITKLKITVFYLKITLPEVVVLVTVLDRNVVKVGGQIVWSEKLLQELQCLQ